MILQNRKRRFIFVGSIHQKQSKMTHYVKHQYDELLNVAWPGLEVRVIYNCESEIEVGEEGEHDPRLISINARADGVLLSVALPAPALPRETDGKEAREFLAKLRESARQALWAEALRQAKDAGYTDPQEINTVAYNWQFFGVAELLPGFSKSRSFIE